MQFVYKAMTFDVITNIDQNLIIATYVNPQKIKITRDEQNGQITQAMKYSDIISASIPISENFKPGDDYSKLFGNNNLCFTSVIQRLCEALDKRLKQ